MAEIIWVYAEIGDDKITTTSLEMLAKASEVGKAEAILLGPAPENAVSTLANHGATKIYRCADPLYRDYLTLPAAETVAGLIQKHQPAVMLFASSYSGRDLVANLSARLDCGAITDVGDFQLKDGSVEATIPALGASYQNASTLLNQGTKLLVVRPKSFEPKVDEQPVAVEEVAPSSDEGLRKVQMTERVTVLSGALHVGMGDKLAPEASTALGPGGYVSLPAMMHHFAWTATPTVVQVSLEGPFDIFYINPTDDPQKRQSSR